MSTKLVVYVIHGIGPQNNAVANGFSAGLRRSVKALCERNGIPFSHADLLIASANWSGVFENQAQQWLANNYPNFEARTAIRRPALSWGLRLLGFIAGAELLFALAWLQGSFLLPASPVVRLAVVAAAALLIALLSVALAFFLAARTGLPWGDLWHAGRGFEAQTLADVIVYQTTEGRQAILTAVMQDLAAGLQEDGLDPADPSLNIPVVLVGHSLGSVICYDILLASAAEDRSPGSSAPQTELKKLEQLQQPDEEQLERRQYLQRIALLETRLRPVALATFGAPVTFFAFRKPALAGRSDLWRRLVPQEFYDAASERLVDSKLSPGRRWSWLNFWHPADFVAHKAKYMFNQGGAVEFVSDRRTAARVLDPISAHSSYWTDPRVREGIAAQIVDWLR